MIGIVAPLFVFRFDLLTTGVDVVEDGKGAREYKKKSSGERWRWIHLNKEMANQSIIAAGYMRYIHRSVC